MPISVRTGLCALCLAVGLVACGAAAGEQRPPVSRFTVDEDRGLPAAPIDDGFGPGVPPSLYARTISNLRAVADQAAGLLGGSVAHLHGAFGPPIGWPVVGTHNVLLPDGRVLSYGPLPARDRLPVNFEYDVWDPSLGVGASSHLILPNTTGADFFCSGQSLVPKTGEVLMTGGDVTIDGELNRSHDETAIFRPGTNRVRAGTPMAFRRWYPTLLALPGGALLAVGGRQDVGVPTPVPEVYMEGSGWRALSGAAGTIAFGKRSDNWYYPRAYLAPASGVFVLAHDGSMWSLNTTGLGTLTQLPSTIRSSSHALPTLMYAPGKLLSLRGDRRVMRVDINGPAPVADEVGQLSQVRLWSSATVMADGRVAITGGSARWNELTGVAYHVDLWDPASGSWTRGASAQKPRLYHSSALLLPDATLLTVGGGLPGPVTQRNAEIYRPPYLFRTDGSGELAVRPDIVGGATSARTGSAFRLRVGPGQTIDRVTLVRTGSDTHSFNADQRFFRLAFTQAGDQLTVRTPATRRIAPPGYYMVFVFNRAGVPSVARILSIPA